MHNLEFKDAWENNPQAKNKKKASIINPLRTLDDRTNSTDSMNEYI